MAWGVGSRCGTPLGAIQALGALLRQHPDPMPDPHQWRMLGLQDPWWPVVTPATLPLAPLPGGQHTWKQTTNKRKKQCNYCEHRCYQSCATCEILGLGHFAACGALAGRDCMKKHVEGVQPIHGNWTMSSPGRKAITAALANKRAKGADGLPNANYADDDSDDDSDDDADDPTGGTPIGGPTRQSPRAKAARAKAKAERLAKRQAKEAAKEAARKTAAAAGRSARAAKRSIEAEA